MDQPVNDRRILLMRKDLIRICDMIPESSRVLDLGCERGRLLYALKTAKHCKVCGVERTQDNVLACAARGIPVIHSNLDNGLEEFSDNTFDYVILSRTIQSVKHPDLLLKDMLRVGKRGIVSYMNFGHINARIMLLLGHFPVTRNLPCPWYDTPTIRPGTTNDFKSLCDILNIKILDEIPLTTEGDYLRGFAKLCPNLFASNSIMIISK